MTEVDLRSDRSYLERYDQQSYTHFINFIKSEKDLKKKFNMFNILNIGEYTISLKDWKRSGHLNTIFAQKKKLFIFSSYEHKSISIYNIFFDKKIIKFTDKV